MNVAGVVSSAYSDRAEQNNPINEESMSLNHLSSLDRFPRYRLLDQATPVQKLENLRRLLPDTAAVNIFVKRDDLMSLGGGGNKLRKLEFLIGAALAEGADTLVTVGGLQSNHARLTAAAAAKAGLHCEIVLGRLVPRTNEEYALGGNVLLNDIFGARVEIAPDGVAPIVRARERVAELIAAGRKPYLIPTGGSTAVGSLGYVACAEELLQQGDALGVQFDGIVVANGSSATHAGLAAGLVHAGKPATLVQAYSTLAEAATAQATTLTLVRETLALLGDNSVIAEADILVDGSQRGPGYGIATEAMREALLALARTEGILVDPVYSGKAFAGMLAAIRAGRYQPGANILFVMTGGTPALYAYRDALQPA